MKNVDPDWLVSLETGISSCADPGSFVRGVQKVSEYNQEIPQPHTADQPTVP